MQVRVLFLSIILIVPTAITAQEPRAGEIKPTASRIIAVTVYQNTALVTREVPTPEKAGLTELIVSPLPPSTMPSSLYSEGTDGTRVLSTRYRTRAIAEDTREEVRAIEGKIKELRAQQAALLLELRRDLGRLSAQSKNLERDRALGLALER